MMWLGFLISSSELIQSMNYTYAGNLVAACGGILIVLGFLGFLGIWNNKKLYLIIFSLLGLLIGLLIVSFASILIYVKRLTGEVFIDEETCIKNFYDADQLSILAEDVMCGLYCPCNVKMSTRNILTIGFAQGSANSSLSCNPCENIQKYDYNTQENIISWVNSTLGYQVQNTSCAVPASQFIQAYFPSENRRYIPLLTWLEENLQCSGFCTKQNVLLFSDINKSIPKNACFHSIKTWTQQNLLNYGVMAMLFGFYQVFVSILAFSIACCNKKKVEVLPAIELESKHKAGCTSFE